MRLITVSPMKPQTTLGMAANISTNQFSGVRNQGGQSSARKMAIPRLIGTASTNAMLMVVGMFIVMGWKTAGWIGLDRWLLPMVGTPWQAGKLAVFSAILVVLVVTDWRERILPDKVNFPGIAIGLGFSLIVPLRASVEQESIGLDVALHGEEAYTHAQGSSSMAEAGY